MAFLTEAANRGSISTGPYQIENSLKVERTNTEYLHRTVSSAGNAKVWCASMWIKRSELDGSQQFWQFLSSMTSDGGGGYSGWPTRIGFWYSTDGLWVDSRHGTGNARLTSLVFQRDTSAWYHIVVMQDTTQSTDTNRTKIYINGTLLLPADLDYDQYPTQNADTAMHVLNSRVAVGAQADGGYPWSGYIADVHLLDGQTGKTPSDFAEYDEDSGIWIPKQYTGAYGTNGFHLKFEDSSNMGLDSSGNGNNLTSNNITAADQSTDTPTNNFCTWNPLWQYKYVPTITEGATKVRYTDSTDENAKATIGLTSGKWYWEAKPVGTIGSQYIGIQTDGDSNAATLAGLGMNYTMVINPTGKYYSYAGSLSESSDQGWDLTASDWLGIALDMDSGTQTIKYYKNGSLIQSLNLISEMQGQTVFPFLQNYENRSWDINFGGYTINTISSAATDEDDYGTFEYAPPSGHFAICTKNLAEHGG
mgnify:FL=1